MLRRLADRVEEGPEGDILIPRYGMWGISAEVEERGPRQWVLINGKKKEEVFYCKEAAEIRMKELFNER